MFAARATGIRLAGSSKTIKTRSGRDGAKLIRAFNLSSACNWRATLPPIVRQCRCMSVAKNAGSQMRKRMSTLPALKAARQFIISRVSGNVGRPPILVAANSEVFKQACAQAFRR